jgi:ribulose-phosphate 3-epimerase
MIVQPEKFINEVKGLGTMMMNVHYETCTHLHRVVQQIKDAGMKAGVTLNPATPVCVLKDIICDLDMVLLMSVNPGFGGQKYIPSALAKVQMLDQIRRECNLNFKIEIDGGINLDNFKEVTDAGVDIAVAGSAVFGADDVEARVKEFLALVDR